MSRAQSYGHRIRNRAEELGIDAQRLRRSLVFQRALARFARADGWVLKGGFCLEVRLALDARSTVDLDLVTRTLGGSSPGEVQDLLDEILDVDLDDGFTFTVGLPQLMSAADARPAWRSTVKASVDGLDFATIKLDVVAQFAELAGAVERLRVEPPLSLEGIGVIEIDAVDVHQHAAEKFHALQRTYAGERPSSRVKDLVDLVLLIDAGLLRPAALAERLSVVYRERDSTSPPLGVAPMPVEWEAAYPELLTRHELTPSAGSATAAHILVADLYTRAIAHLEGHHS